jgi:iron complex outermembrane receptor protein
MKFRWLSSAIALAAMPAGLAFAQDNTDATASEVDEIVVLGSVRQAQAIGGEELLREAPGTSPIKLVERLPGVNYSGADAFGAYEWAVRINIRGFQQQQLGFTLDGIPLGDMSYGNFNGLHVSRAVISENLESVELSQGAGLLSTHSTSNLGGTLQFVSRAPAEEYGGQVALTIGDQETFRGFARLDTGAIDGVGLRAYVSYVDNDTYKWKQGGGQHVDHWNAGFAQPIDEGELSGYYSRSRRRETDFQDLSLAMIDRLGYNWDNFAPDWDLANLVADIANNFDNVDNATGAPGPDGLSDITGMAPTNPAAGDVFPAPIATVDDAYYDASGLRDDDLMRLTYETPLGENMNFSGTYYHHEQEGQGIWFTPYVNPFAFGLGTPGVTAPVSVRTTEYDMVRNGGFADVTLKLGDHEIAGGFWLENNSFRQSRRFYANTREAPRPTLNFMREPFATQWDFDYEFDTTTFYLQDTWEITEALTALAGFKSVKVETRVETLANGFAAPAPGSDQDLRGSIASEDNFLPQVGVTYDIGDSIQAFGSYTENMRAFDLAPFNNLSQIAFEAIGERTNPESSKTLEGGVRVRGDRFRAVGALYFVQFDDRLLGIRVGAGIQGNPSIISNVGGVETKGVELAGEYEFTDDVSLFVSYAYNDSQYEDDVVNAQGDVLQATAGATVVNAPHHLLKADLSYDNGSLFATLSGNYTSERETAYTNVGGQVDGFALFDLSAGYRFDGADLLDGLEIQLNVTNLFDEEYVSTIGTNGFIAVDPNNANQTLMVGAPRQAFVTLRKAF